MIGVVALAAVSHVPIFPDSIQYTVERDANISQVVYFPHGVGVVAVPQEFMNNPNDAYYFDVVYREKDHKFDVEISCGNWESDDEEILTQNVPSAARPSILGAVTPKGHLEPFTQTSYYSFYGENAQLTNCTGKIEITVAPKLDSTGVGFGAIEPGSGPIAIVIGKAEEFTFGELMSTGHYALELHGSYWAGLGWTYWTFLALSTVLVALSLKMASIYGGGKVLFDDKLREYFYWAAVVGFSASFLEFLTHTGVAQAKVPVGGALAVALVLSFMNLVWLAIILCNMYLDNKYIQSPVWGPLELVTAFSCFLLFGTGYYIAPSFWMAAALVRCYRLGGGTGGNSLYA